MRKHILAIALSLCPVAANAQVVVRMQGSGVGHNGDGDLEPVDRVRGEGQMYQQMLNFRRNDRDDKRCRENGCLIIANPNPTYDLIGLYFSKRPASEEPVPTWGPNQFGSRFLKPSGWTVADMTGDSSMCGLGVRLEFRNRQTKEIREVTGLADLCRRPGTGNWAISIRLEVESDKPAPAPQADKPAAAAVAPVPVVPSTSTQGTAAPLEDSIPPSK